MWSALSPRCPFRGEGPAVGRDVRWHLLWRKMNAGRRLLGDPPSQTVGLRCHARASGEPLGHTERRERGPRRCLDREHSSRGRHTRGPVRARCVWPQSYRRPAKPTHASVAQAPVERPRLGARSGPPGPPPRPLGAELQAVRPGLGRHLALPRVLLSQSPPSWAAAPLPLPLLPPAATSWLCSLDTCPTLARRQPGRSPPL